MPFRIILAAFLVNSLAACSFTTTYNGAVEILGDVPAAEKLEVAKSVAAELREPAVLAEFLADFPGLSETDDRALRVGHSTMSISSPGEDGRKTLVFVKCSLTANPPNEALQAVVSACESRARASASRKNKSRFQHHRY